MDSGEIESQDGTRRAYVLKTITDILVSAELERRIVALEEKHEQRLQDTRSLTGKSPIPMQS
jgi:hypothetical protein